MQKWKKDPDVSKSLLMQLLPAAIAIALAIAVAG